MLIFRDCLPQDKDWFIPMGRKSVKGTRRSVWMNTELQIKLKPKKETYKWKSNQVTQKKYRDTVSELSV